MASRNAPRIHEYIATFEHEGVQTSVRIESLAGTRDDEIRASVTRSHNLPTGTPIAVLKGPRI